MHAPEYLRHPALGRRLGDVSRRAVPALRGHWILATVVLILLLLAVFAGRLLGEPARGWLEREANERLQGYTVRIGDASVRPWVLAGTVHDLVIVQAAHPERPVARFPEISVDVDWGALLRARLVADLELVRPAVHIDTQQLREEWEDEVPVKDKGWQQLWELYPLKINHFLVTDGTLSYLDSKADRRLRLSHVQLEADNIRHVTGAEDIYPSPVTLEGVVFEKGRLTVEGHADFLRRPHAAFHVLADIGGVPLAALGTVVDDYRIRLKGGTLGARGEFEIAPELYIAELDALDVSGLAVDYVSGADNARIARARRAVEEASRFADESPAVRLRARAVTVSGEFGYVSDTDPRYRVFLDDARLRLTNYSNRAAQGESQFSLDGRFMGGGPARVRGVIRPDPGRANFALDAAIGRTDLRLLNEVLRAHGKFDVSAGTVALYSQVQVRDGRINGYLKPLIKDIEVEGEQDEEEGFFQRLYEKIVEQIAKILENQPREEVASIVDLSGPLDDPDASILQIVGSLLRNAFVKAILPGFEPELAPESSDKPSADVAPPMRPRPRGTYQYAWRADERSRAEPAGEARGAQEAGCMPQDTSFASPVQRSRRAPQRPCISPARPGA